MLKNMKMYSQKRSYDLKYWDHNLRITLKCLVLFEWIWIRLEWEIIVFLRHALLVSPQP